MIPTTIAVLLLPILPLEIVQVLNANRDQPAGKNATLRGLLFVSESHVEPNTN